MKKRSPVIKDDPSDEQPDRPTMRQGKCPKFPDAKIYIDYCARCPERKGCKK